MQVASRLLLVWGIIYNFHPLARSPAYSSMLTAWSVTEVIRYSYFVLNLSGYHSRVITWLRYNTFYVLYPMGISSECWLIYRAVTPAGKMRAEYAWALQLILIIYIPGEFHGIIEGGPELILGRLVYPLFTYDGPEEEGCSREAN